MKKNSLKKLNKFVCCLVILSMFLQFVPSRQPAQAGIIGEWLSKLATKISIPSVLLNEKGGIMLGKYPLAVPDLSDPLNLKKAIKIECLGCAKWSKEKDPATGKLKCLECVNPFSLVSLGTKSQKALVEPTFIPGCLEAQEEEAKKRAGIDINNIKPAIGQLKFDYTIYPELNPDYITKKITGCTEKPPCLEPQESVGTVIGCGNPQIVDKYALRGAPGCYDWYKGDQESVISKDNDTWRTYWEELARKFGTYENIKKVYTFCAEGGNCPEFWGWGGVKEELAGALQDLATPSGSSYGYTLLKAMDFTQSNVAHKNLYEYVFNGGFKAPDTMGAKHLYFLRKMLMVLPSFEKLIDLDTPDSKWWGNNDSDTNSTRRKIKSGIDFLQAGIQNDLKVLSLTLDEIKKAGDEKKNEILPVLPDCANPKAGEVLVPKPYMLPQCELKIPLPGDAICDTATDEKCEIKKLAQGKACTYLARLQDAASQEVFTANKIFNATDPFTDCLFIRNCRSNCSLRLGEVTFTVTLLDVAALFVPGGFLTVLQKILNIVKIIKEAWTILTTIQTLFDDGVNFLNQIFNVMGQVSSLFSSFTASGLKMSDVLIYGGGAVASYFGGKEIQEIGKDKGGNIGWLIKKGGDTLSAGDGLVGGAAATMLFNTDRAKKASSGMQDTLAGFAQSNLMFATAKNEAIKYNTTLKSDIENVKQVFKLEKPIAFLFQTEENNAKKKELNGYLNDFSLFITRVSDFFDEINSTLKLNDGKFVSVISKGGGGDEFIAREKYDPEKEIPIALMQFYCTSSLLYIDVNGIDEKINNNTGELNCFIPNRVNAMSGNNITCPPNGNWFEALQKFSVSINTVGDFFELTDPEYIKKKITGCAKPVCLEPDSDSSGGCQTSEYDMYATKDDGCSLACYRDGGVCDISEKNKSWREYWEEFGKRVGTFENIKNAYEFCKNSSCNKTEALAILENAVRDLATPRNNGLPGTDRAWYMNESNEYGKKVSDFVQNDAKYKNIFEFLSDTENPRVKKMSMRDRHKYYIRTLVPMYPSLAGIAFLDSNFSGSKDSFLKVASVLNTYTAMYSVGAAVGTLTAFAILNSQGLSWGGENASGLNSTRRAIKDALEISQKIIKDEQKFSALSLSAVQDNAKNLYTCVNNLPLRTGEYKYFFNGAWWNTVLPSGVAHWWEYDRNGESLLPSLGYKFKESYEGEVAFEDWDERIKIINKNIPEDESISKLSDVKQALDLGLSPERPIVVYKAEKAKKYLDDMVADVKKISGSDAEELNELAQKIINDLIAQIDEDIQVKKDEQDKLREPNNTSYSYDYRNYGNCCAEKNSTKKGNSCCNLGTECKAGLDKYKDMYLGNVEKGIKGVKELCDNCLEQSCESCPDTNPVVCDNDGRCDVGETHSNCPNDCDEVVKYKCSGTNCVRDDANGTYTTSNCDGKCVVVPPDSGNYKCRDISDNLGSGNAWCKCIESPLESNLNCSIRMLNDNPQRKNCYSTEQNCIDIVGEPNPIAKKYKCSGAPNYTCSENSSGIYNTFESCQNACKNPNPNSGSTRCRNLTYIRGALSPTPWCNCNENPYQTDQQCSFISGCYGAESVCKDHELTGTPVSICGNGDVEEGEECDDDNTRNGDGCSSRCRNEGNGSVCGNGVIELGEQCDDGNTRSNDGCSFPGCQNEGGNNGPKACGNAPQTTQWCLCPANLVNNGVATNACIERYPDPCIYRNKAECEGNIGFLNNVFTKVKSAIQKLVKIPQVYAQEIKVKSTMPFATNIFDNVKQRLGSFVKSLIKIPEVFASIVEGNCTKSGTKWVCDISGICQVADKCSQADCFKKCVQDVQDVQDNYCYPGCGGGICNNSQVACDAAFDASCTNNTWCIQKEDVYNKYKCFENYEPIYKPGYDEYNKLQAQIDELLGQREFLVKNKGSFTNALTGVADMLKGNIDNLSKKLTKLQMIWEETTALDKIKENQWNQESIIARAYVEKIVKLQSELEGIMNNDIPAVQTMINSVTEMAVPIEEMRKNVPKGNFKDILNIVSEKLYLATSTITTDVIQYAVDNIGPIKIGNNDDYGCKRNTKQFLYRLKCFEEDNKQVTNKDGKTFKDLLSYMDVLENFENAGFRLKQVAETLPLIEPSLDMEPLELKSGLSDEISEKAQCCRPGCVARGSSNNTCSYSETYINAKGEGARTSALCSSSWTQAKCGQQTTLFVGQKEGESNSETFQKGILANPINSLQDNFLLLRNYLYSSSVISVSALLNNTQNLMESPALRGIDADITLKSGKKEKAYSPVLKDLADKSSMDLWEGLIWGDEVSEKTRLACDAVTQVLGKDPEDIAKECKTRTTQEVNVNLLPPEATGGINTKYKELTERCALLSKMDLDVLENIANDPDYIAKRIADLNEQRSCITKEDCNFGGSPCIVCPNRFCLNEKGVWAVLESQAICEANPSDPNCKEDEICKDIRNGGPFTGENTKDKPNDGLYYTNRIIWDTTTHGVLPSENPNQNYVCNGLGLDSIHCGIDNVNERCALMDNFLARQTCNLFDRCSTSNDEEIKRQERIKKWRDLSVANQCPKWFCLKNNSLMWAGSTWINGGANGGPSDSYCQQEYVRWQPNQNMGYVPATNGIIWDTSVHPTAGDQVWPPEKNWLGQSITSITAGGMVNNCILAQTGLQNERALDPVFLDSIQTDCSPISPISGFCTDKTTCTVAKNSCIAWVDQQAERNRQQQTAKPLMEWPPTTRCENDPNPTLNLSENIAGFAQKYTGAQAMCIGTQQEIVDLAKIQQMIDDIKTKTTDCSNCKNTADVLNFLTNQCNKVEYQKAFALDCYNFSVLQQAFGNNPTTEENWKDWNKGDKDFTTEPPKWDPKTEKTSAGKWTTEDQDVKNIKSAINGFCHIETSGKIVGKKLTFGKDYEDFRCGILGNNVGVDFTLNTDEAKTARELAGKICSESSSDMRTPLNEVMKVFSVLLGIKSYTSAKNGISALYFDAQKIQKRARDMVALIKGFPDKFMELWGQEDTISKITKSNFDVKPLLCIEGPMTSYAGDGKKALTGPEGGQVCSDVGEEFSQLDTLFSSVRQNFIMVDKARRKPTTSFGLLKDNKNKSILKLEISDPLGDIDPELREIVRPMYQRAESIKEKSQLLWALASAINFANENCTCGQSYCPMIGKVPFCVSGLPITFSPLKEPFCHLVWTLRYPLGSLAERLKQDIENPSE